MVEGEIKVGDRFKLERDSVRVTDVFGSHADEMSVEYRFDFADVADYMPKRRFREMFVRVDDCDVVSKQTPFPDGQPFPEDGELMPDCSVDDWSKAEAAAKRLEAAGLLRPVDVDFTDSLWADLTAYTEEQEYSQAMAYWREMNSVAV